MTHSSTSCWIAACVAVRLDHLYGVWQINEGIEPRLMQVIDTQDVATCVSVRWVKLKKCSIPTPGAKNDNFVCLWSVLMF